MVKPGMINHKPTLGTDPVPPPAKVYGFCTACGSVEVELNNATHHVFLGGLDEEHKYPAGYGCEVCD